MLLGGAPEAGKTALATQMVIDALRFNKTLRACVCNVEMRAPALFTRQLAERISGLDASDIRHVRFTDEHDQRIADALDTLESLKDRLCFMKPPFNWRT